MRYLKTSEAAALLNVSPNTLRAWERRFGFPNRSGRPVSTDCSHTAKSPPCGTPSRRVCRSRRPFRARARDSPPTRTRWSARSSRTTGSGRTPRSRRRSRCARSSAPWRRSCFRRSTRSRDGTRSSRPHGRSPSHWAADWLRRAIRLAPPPVRQVTIVSAMPRATSSTRAPYIRALELFCVRAGIKVLSLSARGVAGIGDAANVYRPNLVVVAGGHLATTPSRDGRTRSGLRSARCRSRSSGAATSAPGRVAPGPWSSRRRRRRTAQAARPARVRSGRREPPRRAAAAARAPDAGRPRRSIDRSQGWMHDGQPATVAPPFGTSRRPNSHPPAKRPVLQPLRH